MNVYRDKLESRKVEMARREAAYREAAAISKKIAQATDVSEDVQGVFRLQVIALIETADKAAEDLVEINKMLGQDQINRHNGGIENLSIARVAQFQATGK